MIATQARTTWPELTLLVPQLADLEAEVELGNPDDWHAYESWKRRLQSLVGFGSPESADLPMGAYDVAHTHLLNVWECSE